MILRQTIRFAAFTIPHKACAGFVMQQKQVVVLVNQKIILNKS
jgi:hypothetical protein